MWHQSVRLHPAPNSYPARGIGEQCLRWSPGSRGRAFQQLLGNKTLTHAVTGTSWAAPSKHKNKRGSDSTVAGCLGIYSLDCSPGMMVSLLYSGHCFRRWYDAHSQENCYLPNTGFRVISTSRINADIQQG